MRDQEFPITHGAHASPGACSLSRARLTKSALLAFDERATHQTRLHTCCGTPLVPFTPSALPYPSGYLGEDRSTWSQWDGTHLLRSLPPGARRPPLLVDVGSADKFLEEQLKVTRVGQEPMYQF